MRGSVTNRQLFFFILLPMTTYTSVTIPKFIAQGPGTGGWLPIMVNALIFALLAALVVRLNSAFPGRMVADYSADILGKVAAYAISVYLILYFIFLMSFLSVRLTDILKAEFYPRSPEWALLLASFLVFAIIVYHGIKNMGRFYEIIGTVFIIISVITHLIMLFQGNVVEILPLFRLSQIEKYAWGLKDTLLSFLGIEVLLIIPLSGRRSKRSIGTAFMSVIVIGVFYVLVVETTIMKLGMRSTQNYNFPTIEAIKQIQFPVIERFDIVFLTAGFGALVAGFCSAYLAVVEIVTHLLKKARRIYIVIGVGAFVMGIQLFLIKSADTLELLNGVLLIAGVISAAVIPITLMAIAKVRKLDQKMQ